MAEQGYFTFQVWNTAALLAAQPGPQTATRYAYVKDVNRFYYWVPNDSTSASSIVAIEPTGGGAGRWLEIAVSKKGTDLTDADATYQVADSDWVVLPASTLTDNRTLTLGTTKAVSGHRVTVTRLDEETQTYTIANGGAGGGNLAVFASGQRSFLDAEYDGTNWVAVRAAQMPGTS